MAVMRTRSVKTWPAIGMLAAACVLAAAQAAPAGKRVYQTEAASRCVEKVRSQCLGTTMAVFVKPGDHVFKGQILGHAELEKAKLDHDLALAIWEAKSNVKAAECQADAWRVTREETENAVRKRDAAGTRLDWAAAMEGMYKANYEAQLDAENNQRLQYEYCKGQYEKRFFRSAVDGVVTEVKTEPGRSVALAAHVFTVSKDGYYSLLVRVSSVAAAALRDSLSLPVRPAGWNTSGEAKIEEISDDPNGPDAKIVRLLVNSQDFPAAMRGKLNGSKFDVLVPEGEVASE